VRIGIPKEIRRSETRVPVVPETVEKLVTLGAEVCIQAGLGDTIKIADEEYTQAGAVVVSDRKKLISTSDIVLRINKPPAEEIALLKAGSLHISYLDPFNEQDLVRSLADRNVRAISMEMIPRTTKAQKMDALSSQASLAGYVSVILAAERLDSVFPMMTTPAGTIYPARVFVIGAGVAGLQAIATAKRLGARVEAFDTRPVVEEQVRSLGARFVKVELGASEQTKDGYARELTAEQLQKQQELMSSHCMSADVVITTAQVFGKKAPLIIPEGIVKGMKPGSVIVDMAVESGGNVALSRLDEEVDVGGVRILGFSNLSGKVPVHASQMYSSNLVALIEEFWDKEEIRFDMETEDEILAGCVITRDGRIVNEKLKEIYR
jgi:H+-translocating NAD(P) transhydrogenase subunit alpha